MPGIDVHAHLVAPELLAGIEDGAAPPALGDPDALVRRLDDARLDLALVSPPPPFFGLDLPPDGVAAWVTAVNDGLASVVQGSAGRLLPLAYVPLSAPELAAEEAVSRIAAGFVGVTLATSSGAITLADSRLEPLWHALDELGAFVLVHPVDPPDGRLRDFHLTNLVGFPCETALAAACLVFGGALARHRGIRFCLAHAGGAVPALAGRWQRAYEVGRVGGAELKLAPRDALRRLFVDSLAYSDGVLRVALEVFGRDHVLLGSDWPFPLGESRPLDGMAAELRGLVAVENPARLLSHLDPGAAAA